MFLKVFLFVLIVFLASCEERGCDRNWISPADPSDPRANAQQSGGGIIGMNVHTFQFRDFPERMPETMEKLKAMRISAVRTAYYSSLPDAIRPVRQLVQMAPNYGITTTLVVINSGFSSCPPPSKGNWDNIVQEALSSGASHIQVLNEPSGCRLPPGEYLRDYLIPAAKKIRAGGKKVVSTAPSGDSDGLSYFKQMLEVKDEKGGRILEEFSDIIAVHSYATPASEFIGEIRKRGINKPVWITETGDKSRDRHIEIFQRALSSGAEAIFWYCFYETSQGFGLGYALFEEQDGTLVPASPLVKYLEGK